MGGSLEYTEITKANSKHNWEFSNFVETGTHVGITVCRMSPHFSKIFTFEIVPELYQQAKKPRCPCMSAEIKPARHTAI